MAKKTHEILLNMDSRLNNIDVTLAKQSVILTEHVKRSTMLEEQLKPVQKHVAMVDGALRLLGILLVIAGVIAAFWQAWKSHS